MLDFVVDFAFRLIGHAVEKATKPLRPLAPRPNPLRVQTMEAAYAKWAKRHGLERDEPGRCYRGRLASHQTVTRPGLDESTPSGVEIEAEIDHDQRSPVLLSAASDGATELEKALCELFADAAFARDLRSVAVTRRGVRMRFRPLTPPETVEIGLLAAISAIQHSRARARPAPYR